MDLSIYLEQVDTKRIVITGLIILFAWLFQRYILKTVFTKISSRLEKADSHFHVHVVTLYQRPIRHAFLLITVLYAITYLLGISFWNHPFIEKTYHSILIFYGFWGLYLLLDFYAHHPNELNLARKKNSESVLLPLFFRFVKYFVMCIAFGFISYKWGYDISGIVAGLGIGGIALALGAKDVLSNMFGGMSVALDRPFSRGDWISTEDRKIEGVVDEINFRSTKIITFDKAIIYVPNTVLANKPIINWTRRQVRRVKFQLTIDPSTPEQSIRRAVSRIENSLLHHPGVETDNSSVFVDELTEAGLCLKITYFTNTTELKEYMRTKQEINFLINRIFMEEQIKLSPLSQHVTWERVV